MEWLLIIFLKGDIRLYPEPNQPPLTSKKDCKTLHGIKREEFKRIYREGKCFAVNEEGGYEAETVPNK